MPDPGEPGAPKSPIKTKPASVTPKASGSKTNKPYQQPKFDARIYTRRFLAGPTPLDPKTTPYQGYSPTRPPPVGSKKELVRGQIRQAEPQPGFSDVARINFLFNPSQLSASYAIIGDDATAILTFPNADDVADLNTPINQTISFSLLFDRTYELYDSAYVGKDVQKYGVEVDVIAMKQIVGMTTDLQGATPQAAAGGNTTTSTFVLSGSKDIMRFVRVFVNVGGPTSLSYYGYIQNWDVTYTHWNQWMVPSRCVINVNMMLMPSSTSKGEVKGADGTTAAEPTQNGIKQATTPATDPNATINKSVPGRGGPRLTGTGGR